MRRQITRIAKIATLVLLWLSLASVGTLAAPAPTRPARFGYRADPAIPLELEDIDRRLAAYTDELAQLETQIAEADEPVAEVEYRAQVADAWNTPAGRPTVAGGARLELARLRLGITPERAAVIEQEIRAALAREAFTEIDIGILLGIAPESPTPLMAGMQVSIEPRDSAQVIIEHLSISQFVTQADALKAALRLVGRVVRLDRRVGAELLLLTLPPEPALVVDLFGPQLLATNQAQISGDEHAIFEAFIEDLRQGVVRRQATPGSAW
jgi:hypothetical protein